MAWQQIYDPLSNATLSTVAAALPVVILLGSIAFFHIRIHLAALLGLAAAVAVALLSYRMPADLVTAATLLGAARGLFPIGWIILNLLFLYELTVRRGLFEALQRRLSQMAPDPRIQIILIAFCFGAFFEGAAGFGTPVAVTGAILLRLGFRPLQACGLSLIANTAPVAFGALGTPIITLANVTGLPVRELSAMAGRQLPFFAVLVPFWCVWAYGGLRAVRGIWPAALTAGVSFAVPQFLISNFHGPELVDVVASITSIAAMIVLLKFWRPADGPQAVNAVPNSKISAGTGEGREGEAGEVGVGVEAEAEAGSGSPAATPDLAASGPAPAKTTASPDDDGLCAAAAAATGRKWLPWLPWVVLSLIVFLWGLQPMKSALNSLWNPEIKVPHLHLQVERSAPVAAPPTPTKPGQTEQRAAPDREKAVYPLNLLSATGTGILISALLVGFLLRFSLRELAGAWLTTLVRARFSLLTIAAMLALGTLTTYCGADATLGLALAKTGWLYPFFGTLLGWLGVALTGSDTASNVLFGGLQKISSQQLHIDPILMCAANSTGGVMGKMVDAQSIVVASTATQSYGMEGSILRYVFFHSIALASLVGIMVTLQAYVPPFTWMVPGGGK